MFRIVRMVRFVLLALPMLAASLAPAQETLNLRMILVAPEDRWNALLGAAEERFESEHPNIDVRIDAQILPFGDRLTQLRAAGVAGTPIDIVSLDQPEVGDFAAAGFTTDLSEWIERDLDGLSDWLPAYRSATRFEGGWHAIWAWTDARVMWYWKDLVEEAGVDPASELRTWDDYLANCAAIEEALADRQIEGCLLIGQPWIADWTFPYVWMNGGDLGVSVSSEVARSRGAREPWLPTLDSDAWVQALEFTRDQVEAGLEPYTEHQFGTEFVQRRFAVSLDGTWVLGSLQAAGADLSQVGMVAAFPTPDEQTETATMAGGWTLAIPSTSENPEMAWEFLKAMLDIETLGPVQAEFGYLPTRASFAEQLEEEFAEFWNAGGEDRWAKLQELAPNAYGRPSFPSWPQVGAAITEMIQAVQFDGQDPARAAANAQRTVLTDVLGWPARATVELADDGDCGANSTPIEAVTPAQHASDADDDGTVCSAVGLP
jgi:multiple sugar transport system substrate-binding protein